MTRRRILVPIDFHPHSDAALHHAKKIAAKSRDMISCMYVMEEYGLLTDSLANIEIKRKMRRDAEYKLSERVHSVLKADESTAFELIITSGEVHQKIIEKASDLNAKLIIMGRSNSRGIKNRRIGSNTTYILTHAQLPVITLSENRFAEDHYLVVSLDLSEPLDTLVKCAIDTAQLLHAGVVLISVIEKERVSFEAAYRARLKEIRQLLRAHHIKCNSHLLFAQRSVPAEILAFSNRIDSALILMATKVGNESGSSHIDSTALKVIANSSVPVQCINPRYAPSFLMDELNRTNIPDSLSLSH
jgi:nucleotide-binding universal stress UspA family protein